MRRSRPVLWLISVSLVTRAAFGYSLPTHATLTDNTLNILKSDPRYAEIVGFGSIISQACEAEDDAPRFDCHFYDPDDPLGGLPRNTYTAIYDTLGGGSIRGQYASALRYVSALDWATSNMPDDLDWEGAINAYDYTAASRQQAYTAVAHVLHLMQDMAQPDHARNRPHPGNYAADKIGTVSPWAATQFAAGKLGYEAFAVHLTWTPGIVPRRFESLKEGFDAMARLSHVEEDQRQLPYPDENASGLGPVSFLADEPFHRLYVSRLKRKFQDNLWTRYELHAALQPTIPYPQTDARSQKYTDLAQALLPAAEEYGAGLLVLFKEIVQPPPYIRAVEIRQQDAVKYQAEWVDQVDEDKLGGRTLNTQGGALETGVEAEVTIRFGPRPPDGVTPDGEWWKYVTPRKFVIEYDDGETADLGGWKSIDNDGDPRWVVYFTPTKAGRLAIDALDLYPHYGGRDPEGKGLRGDLLDTNPATPAKAAGLRPFELTGYEPGADRNHSFTVGGGCQGALSREELLRITRYGTWKGSVHFKQHYVHTFKDQVTTTTDWEMTINGQELRMLRGDNEFNQAEIGGRGGTLHTQGFRKWHNYRLPERDGNEPGNLDGEAFAKGGRLTIQDGGPDEPDGWYEIGLMLDPAVDTNSAFNALIIAPEIGNNNPGFAYLKGNLCEAGSISGTRSDTRHRETEATIEDLEWSITWEFEFTGNAPPEHVELCRPVNEYGRLATAISGYQTEAFKLASVAAQSFARQPNAAPAYSAAMTAFSQVARHEELAAVLQEMYDPCAEADNYWLDLEPDSTAKYQERLGQLRALNGRWAEALRGFTERLTTATEELGQTVQPVDTGIARQLRALAAKLKAQGLTAFTDQGP